MYEELYNQIITPHPSGAPFDSKESKSREKYSESYNFSKENFERVQLFISEPVMYLGSELN